MTDLTNSKIERLIAVAEAATPGPWVADIYVCDLDDLPSARDRANVIGAYGDYAKQCLVRELVVGAENSTVRQRTDATHIAAFDPPTAKALCQELLRLRKMEDEADLNADAICEIRLIENDAMGGNCTFVDDGVRKMASELTKLRKENENLRMQAEGWAQEARTQKSTVHEAYQAVSEGTGEPGDWNGARPVRDELTKLRAQVQELRDALEWYAEQDNYVDGPSLSGAVYVPQYPILDDRGAIAQQALGVSDEN